MGTQAQHAAKAESNQLFLDAISELGFADWTATVIFYKAVHLVEKMFADQNIHEDSHKARNSRLRDHHKGVYKNYHVLYSYARWARYDCRAMTPGDVATLLGHLSGVTAKVDETIAKYKK